MSTPKGIIVTGNTQTTVAAAEILAEGGNAYDAILASLVTAPLVEPVLTSLGGGGHLLAYTKENKKTVYDFFAHTPRSKKLDTDHVDFYPATVDFGGAKQDFHIGMGSIAVPGVVRGIFEIHRDLGSLPMKRIVEPAVRLARSGAPIDEFQAGIIDLIEPIFRSTPEAEMQYASPHHKGVLLRGGDRYVNHSYADVLEALAKEGDRLFYEGEIADQIVRDVREKGGYLSKDDLMRYVVVRREPLLVTYRGNTFITNPPPSSGGILIAFALKMLETFDIQNALQHHTYHTLLAFIMEATNKARADCLNGRLFQGDIAETFLDPHLVERYAAEVAGKTNYLGGTTQMSVIDAKGNCASMTSSMGEGSGYIVPHTGIMLNNMLGEEDLHPDGFHQWKEDERISSMMSPSLLLSQDGVRIALGSGGSNRIRTAIIQVLSNVIDRGMTIEDAVKEPRIHFERGVLNVEPGLSLEDRAVLGKTFDHATFWEKQSMFFGGVHSAVYDPKKKAFSGAGDHRRGGAMKIV